MLDVYSVIATAPVSDIVTTGALDFNVLRAIDSLTNFGKAVLAGIIGLFGVIMLIVAAWQVYCKLAGTDQQKQKYNWFLIAILFIVAGVFIFGGVAVVMDIAEGGQSTLQEMGAVFAPLQYSLNS